MSTKMKGLFKGLRYISQIFEEDQQKEQDMQIGLPTDVKHVAHVGWDGGPTSASSADSPNWMKDSGQSTPGMAAPFGADSKPGKNNPEIKWVSEDSKRGQRTKKPQEKEQQGEGPKPSRRRSTDNNPLDTSPKKEKPSRRQSSDNKTAADTAAKPRQPRRSHPKDSSDAAAKEPGAASDVPKKTRRKKSEANDQTSSRRPRNRTAANGGDSAAESGSDGGGAVRKRGAQSCAASEDDEEREDCSRAAQMKESLQN